MLDFRFFSAVCVFVVLPLAWACEGDCIRDITEAFLGNYSTPVNRVFREINNEIITTIPLSNNGREINHYISPLIEDFYIKAPRVVVEELFRKKFHGKCLDSNGYEPAGCPNPNCPIVCGTPGSLVHFFDELVAPIVYNCLRDYLAGLLAPGTETRKRIERMVVADAPKDVEKRVDVHIRGRSFAHRSSGPYYVPENKGPFGSHPYTQTSNTLRPRLSQTGKDMSEKLDRILQEAKLKRRLEEACGGPKFPLCKWDTKMKEYILSFP